MIGGGCGAPDCDVQVQCGACSRAAREQLNAWCRRVGRSPTMLFFLEPEMYEDAHAEALEDDARRNH